MNDLKNINQEKLNDYYWKVWKPNYETYKYSGWALLDKVGPHDQVLDIGCGFNLFKEKLGDRVYGIDPANPKADEMVTWEDYVPHKHFNVYFALGSLNFYPESKLLGHVKKLAEITQPGDRIYWRQNPGIGDHPWKEVKEVQDSFYPWTIELNYKFGKQYNFDIKECKWDSGRRIYAEWLKV